MFVWNSSYAGFLHLDAASFGSIPLPMPSFRCWQHVRQRIARMVTPFPWSIIILTSDAQTGKCPIDDQSSPYTGCSSGMEAIA